MKRAVVCAADPWRYLQQVEGYSQMFIDPQLPKAVLDQLLDHIDWSLLISDGEIKTRQGRNFRNESIVWYTSGTTGASRIYSFTQDQVDLKTSIMRKTYDMTDNDRYASLMPLWHAHGNIFYRAAKSAGCEIDFFGIKDHKKMAKFSPTMISAMPAMIKLFGKYSFENLRFVRSSSAPLPPNLFQQFRSHFRCPVIDAWGMTESLGHCITNPLYGEQRVGTVGLPDGIDVLIKDQRLFIKGPTVSAKDWFETGDLAEYDQKGYIKLLGRSQDLIMIGTVKLLPETIEHRLLQSIDGLEQVVIFGKTNIKILFVGECSKDALAQAVKSQCHGISPSLVEKVGKIPKTLLGKISRSNLDQKWT
jgi:acyl-coenzyme A synthetase/AMP-(fatty) acid ligase